MGYYKNYPHLFSPGKIGNLTIPNRIVMAPMGTCHIGTDWRFNEGLIKFYEQRAKGGTGMIISECNFVAPEIDPFPLFKGTARLDSPNKVAPLAQYAERISEYGTIPALQLSLGFGRQADAPKVAQPVAPSECPAHQDPSVTCRALTVDEIHQLTAASGRAAVLAKRAGIKLIEIHGHAGYLIDQFLNPEINKRTDEYGGSVENRFRIVKEMRDAIYAAIGDSIPVTLRISVDHKFASGRKLEEGIEICKLAEAAGFDALHIDAGRHEVIPWIFPPAYLGKACMLDLAAAVKQAVNIPVIAVGNFGKPEEAEEAITSGKCDFVAMARGLLAEPDWAVKAQQGREDEICPCLRCNELCVGRASIAVELACAVNPECGRETYKKIVKADKQRNITVVGGGPGGMEAAVVAAKRGHKVTLIEKSDSLGGLMKLSSLEDFKYPMADYLDYSIRQVKLAGVDVKLNTEANVESIKATDPDAVIIATGSSSVMPPLPGFEVGNKIGTIKEMVEKENNEGIPTDAKIIIAGGGFIAAESALGLKHKGYDDVTIVEMKPDIATEVMMINRISLLGELKGCGTNILTETTCKCVEGDELICTDKEGNEVRLPFDYLLVAMGMKSVKTIIEDIEEAFPEVYTIGDCVTAGRMHTAIHEGYSVACRV